MREHRPDLEHLVAQATSDALIASSPDGRIQFWNRGATEIFGHSSDETLGRTLAELIVPSERLAEEQALIERARSDGTATLETIRRTKSGSLLYLNMTVRAVRNDAGEIDWFVHSGMDVTRFRLSRDSRSIGARYKDLLESMPDAIVILNDTGRMVLVNARAETVFGYSREELIGQLVEILLPARYHGAHIGHRAHYSTQPRTREMGAGLELYGRRRNGDEFPVEISLSPLRSDEGVLVMSAIRDITDRKKAEQKFRELLESSPDPMVIVNRSGAIVLVNSQTERLFGYARTELLGQSVDMLVPDRFQGRHPEHRTQYFSDPRIRPMGAGLELYGRRKDGSEFPVEISLSPIQTEDGTLVSSSIRDITDRKRFERTLQEKNVELERANLAKDRFLATMSHELRTPLNAIIGFTGTLLMQLPGPLNTQQSKQLNTVQSSARHLLSLINDLLDLAKIESGKVTLDLQPVDVHEVILEVCASLQPAAEAKGLSFRTLVADDAVAARTDRRALSQILINLANNAIKFTETGEIRLEVRRDDRGALAISVEDTGVGIREEDQARLFEAFSRVTSGSSRRIESTGLGLHLSQKLAELLGGAISFRSTLGHGSRFTLTLHEAVA